MRRSVTPWVCLFVLVACRGGYGMAMEQIGPDSVIGHPTVAQPGWPKGIAELPRHPSRVYSIWVNGNENFYFQATPEEVDELVALFSKARMRDHEVVIAAKPRPVKTFKGDAVDYNVSLQIVAGIALFMAREGEAPDLPLEPRLTLFVGDDRALLDKVTWPANPIINSEIGGVSIPSGRTRPQRNVYYGRLEFADGSPPAGFVRGVGSRITLWEQREADGIEVAKVNNEGHFAVLLSGLEWADLQTGKTWLTATVGNFLTEARKTDQRIPAERLTRDKGQARPVQIKGPDYYFGRVLFEDGSPPILDPAPWPGAEITVDFPYAGDAPLDGEGYFKVTFTPEQLEKLSAEKPRKNIYIPDFLHTGQSTAMVAFPIGLLSPDKAKAGVVKIPRPQAPKKDLPTADASVGKPIPGFDNIRFDTFQIDQAKGKPLLICFWDVDQRSSRRCVQTLAKQKDAWQAKNIVILAIHSGTRPHGQVRDWLQRSDISLTIGAIEGDSHDVLLAWGAKGAPWLILTDEQHIVTNEGFGLDEFTTSK